MLEQLIDNHHYSPNGFSIVPEVRRRTTPTRTAPATPATIHSAARAMSSKRAIRCSSRRMVRRRSLNALGISYAPLQNIMHSDGRDRSEAIAMNKAM